jgi:hypothetical protein
MVRCKFYCHSKVERLSTVWSPNPDTGKQVGTLASVYDYKFNVVADGTPEEKAFFASTPSGELSVTTVKDGTFVVGKKYYLDIIEPDPLPDVVVMAPEEAQAGAQPA